MNRLSKYNLYQKFKKPRTFFVALLQLIGDKRIFFLRSWSKLRPNLAYKKLSEIFEKTRPIDFRCMRTLSAGMASAASSATLRAGSSAHAIPAGVAGQQDVGHAIVATGRGVLRLPHSTPINSCIAYSGSM
ncbi:hypothetical protein X953_12635 [Virgibacillus sp. SK37]|nr:hypothetical protein X953_12635 [Virgibacillus sp. SK37]